MYTITSTVIKTENSFHTHNVPLSPCPWCPPSTSSPRHLISVIRVPDSGFYSTCPGSPCKVGIARWRVQVRLLDLAHKNTGSPVKCEFQVNNEHFFSIRMFHAVFGVLLTGHPLFYLATLSLRLKGWVTSPSHFSASFYSSYSMEDVKWLRILNLI